MFGTHEQYEHVAPTPGGYLTHPGSWHDPASDVYHSAAAKLEYIESIAVIQAPCS
jgi:hypothetical protein